MKLNIGKYTLEISLTKTPVVALQPEWVKDYGEYIKEGSLLMAVKLLKDETKCGLKAAKDYSDIVKAHYRTTGEILITLPLPEAYTY